MTNRQEVRISLSEVAVCYARRSGYLSRKRFWALNNVSFDVRSGETLGVIGRNGAGKSTLLQLMAGIIDPDRGIVRHHGCTASLLTLQVGFISYLSGRDNAILSGMLLGLSKREVKARMNAIIEFSELGDFIEQPISTYSSGMRARLGFSVAFQADPDVLLIDEALGVGDAYFKQKSEAVMAEKIRSRKTIVLVSHSAQVIKDLCHRVVWLEDGVSKMVGAPEEVFEAYVKDVTASEEVKKGEAHL